MSVKVEVWGDYACFSRPELKVERVSYDIPTPSAARGILSSIYWHPGLEWHIDRIFILNPIKFINIRRNEMKSKISARAVRTVMSGGKEELYIA
ncbi:MAG: type I-C CRISPR-associated protein Cas5c, partial [Oscillospiraceae bacterium]